VYVTTKRGDRVFLTWTLSYLAFLGVIGVSLRLLSDPPRGALSIGGAVFVDERILPWLRGFGQGVIPTRDPSIPRKASVAGVLLLVVPSTLAYQAATIPVSAPTQAQAYDAVVRLAPAGGLVIANPAYLWILQQCRPDLWTVSWFASRTRATP